MGRADRKNSACIQYTDKLEFAGMPPRAMRAFARVIVFPSFGHARFVFAVVVYSI